jgi:hypothetical protein
MVAADPADRRAALEALLARGEADTPERYGWTVAAAAVATRLPVSADAGPLAAGTAAALLSAGLVAPASRWWRIADDLPEADRASLWAMLAAVSREVPASNSLYDAWSGTVPPHRAALLAAGLRGLGRAELGEAPEPLDNDWTRALDRAVTARRAGEVILLAASGMRMGWSAVPPDYLRRIAAALSAVGFGAEARLIVAEAAARG